MVNTDFPGEDLDEVLDNVERQIKSDIDEYTNFQLWCEEAIESWQERNPAEKESFRQVLREFEYLREEKVEPDEINDVRNRLTEAYREPIAETVREIIRSITDELQLGFTSDQIDNYVEIVRNRSDREIQSTREDYQDAKGEVEDLPNPAQAYLQEIISDNDSIILNPRDKLLPEIETASESYDNLSEIADTLSELDWAPEQDSTLEENVSNYPFVDDDLSKHIQKLESIDTLYSEIKDNSLDISDVISNEISESVDEGTDELLENLEELHESLKHIEKISHKYETATRISEVSPRDIPDEDGMITEGPSKYVENVDSVDDLKDSMGYFEQNYRNWESHLERRWNDLVAIIDTYHDQFDYEIPDSISTEIDILDLLNEGPEQAINTFQEAQEWVDNRGTELSDELDSEAVRLMNELIQEGAIRAKDYDIETIAELHGKVPLVISIDE